LAEDSATTAASSTLLP